MFSHFQIGPNSTKRKKGKARTNDNNKKQTKKLDIINIFSGNITTGYKLLTERTKE